MYPTPTVVQGVAVPVVPVLVQQGHPSESVRSSAGDPSAPAAVLSTAEAQQRLMALDRSWPAGLCSTIARCVESHPLRIMIVDNSGSMQVRACAARTRRPGVVAPRRRARSSRPPLTRPLLTRPPPMPTARMAISHRRAQSSDGNRLVAHQGTLRTVGCTRWEELREDVISVGAIAGALGARTDFHLLNPRPGFSAATLCAGSWEVRFILALDRDGTHDRAPFRLPCESAPPLLLRRLSAARRALRRSAHQWTSRRYAPRSRAASRGAPRPSPRR